VKIHWKEKPLQKERVVCKAVTFFIKGCVGEVKELGTPLAIMRQTNGKTLFSNQLLRAFITGVQN
jgi:hypothetical protein